MQGVAWDPKNEFVVTLSSDKHARFYSIAKGFQCVSRLHQAAPVIGVSGQTGPPPPLFADDMVTRSFFRRAGFSPDGRFVILPGGVVEIPNPKLAVEKEAKKDSEPEEKSKDNEDADQLPCPSPALSANNSNNNNNNSATTVTRHAAHLISVWKTNRPNKPLLSWPSPRRAIIAARFCPLTFEPVNVPAKKRDVDGLPVPSKSTKTRRKFVAALVAADGLILVETSKTCRPIGYVGGLHLDQLTDAAWSHDGRVLISCSTDGYCTLVVFNQNELGTPMITNPEENSTESNIVDNAETQPVRESKPIQPAVAKPIEGKYSFKTLIYLWLLMLCIFYQVVKKESHHCQLAKANRRKRMPSQLPTLWCLNVLRVQILHLQVTAKSLKKWKWKKSLCLY